MQVLELDVMDVRIVEKRNSAQRKHFLYFTDERIFSILKEICRMLGYYGNVYLLVDHFMDLYKESSVYRKQAAMVLNEMVTGAAGIRGGRGYREAGCAQSGVPESSSGVNHRGVHQPEPLAPVNPYYLVSISNGVEGKGNPLQLVQAVHKSSTIHEVNSNIWQICILLEGIGCFAQALEMDFRLILMTLLYPVLEKAGHETLLISQAALDAMWDISQACGYASIKELINENSDYLLNDVSLNLQRVLTVMFSHSNPSLLPLVGDIVQDVMLALDISFDETFCTVLH
ncbi:unnamed protein product [Coregonus sp. 'balchen']|nr:unnamed protein product [Coregonus sp. 'balchen']